MNSNDLQFVELFPQFMDSLNGKNMILNDVYIFRDLQRADSAHRIFVSEKGTILNRLIYSDFSNNYKNVINHLSFHYKSMNIEVEKDYEKRITEYMFKYLQFLLLPKKINKINLYKKIIHKIYKEYSIYINQNSNFTKKLNKFLCKDYL